MCTSLLSTTKFWAGYFPHTRALISDETRIYAQRCWGTKFSHIATHVQTRHQWANIWKLQVNRSGVMSKSYNTAAPFRQGYLLQPPFGSLSAALSGWRAWYLTCSHICMLRGRHRPGVTSGRFPVTRAPVPGAQGSPDMPRYNRVELFLFNYSTHTNSCHRETCSNTKADKAHGKTLCSAFIHLCCFLTSFLYQLTFSSF